MTCFDTTPRSGVRMVVEMPEAKSSAFILAKRNRKRSNRALDRLIR